MEKFLIIVSTGVSDRDFCPGIFGSGFYHYDASISFFPKKLFSGLRENSALLPWTMDTAPGLLLCPKRKTPDAAELVRGKTGRVYGDLMALLTVMKGIPLAYNKDMQEDKEALFDAVDTVKKMLDDL